MYYIIYGIECHVHNCITYPTWRHMLGYIDDHQLHHQYHLMTLGVHMHLLIISGSWLSDIHTRHRVLRELQTLLLIFHYKMYILLDTLSQDVHMNVYDNIPTQFFTLCKTSLASNLSTWFKSISIHERFSWPSMTTLCCLPNDPPMQSKVNTIGITPLPHKQLHNPASILP